MEANDQIGSRKAVQHSRVKELYMNTTGMNIVVSEDLKPNLKWPQRNDC